MKQCQVYGQCHSKSCYRRVTSHTDDGAKSLDAYLDTASLSYLRTRLNYAPQRVLGSSDGDDGLHRLHSLDPGAVGALVWSSRRFGHVGRPTDRGHDQTPVFSADGALPLTDAADPVVVKLGSGVFTLRTDTLTDFRPGADDTFAVAAGFNENGSGIGASTGDPTPGATTIDLSPFILGASAPGGALGGGNDSATLRVLTRGQTTQDFTEYALPSCRAVPHRVPADYSYGGVNPDSNRTLDVTPGSDYIRYGLTAWILTSVDDGSGQFTLQNAATQGFLVAQDEPSPPLPAGARTRMPPGYAPTYPGTYDGKVGALPVFLGAALKPLLPLASLKAWSLYKDGSALWTALRRTAGDIPPDGNAVVIRNSRTGTYLQLFDDNPLFGYLTVGSGYTGRNAMFRLSVLPVEQWPSGFSTATNIPLRKGEISTYQDELASGAFEPSSTAILPAAETVGAQFEGLFTFVPVPTGDIQITDEEVRAQISAAVTEARKNRNLGVLQWSTETVDAYTSWANSATGEAPRDAFKLPGTLDMQWFHQTTFMAAYRSGGRAFLDCFGASDQLVMLQWASKCFDQAIHSPPARYAPTPKAGSDLRNLISSYKQNLSQLTGRITRVSVLESGVSALNAFGGVPGGVSTGWEMALSSPNTVELKWPGLVVIAAVIVKSTTASDSPAGLSGIVRVSGRSSTIPPAIPVPSLAFETNHPIAFAPALPVLELDWDYPYPDSASPLWSWLLWIPDPRDGGQLSTGFQAIITRAGPAARTDGKTFGAPLSAIMDQGLFVYKGAYCYLNPDGPLVGDTDIKWWIRPLDGTGPTEQSLAPKGFFRILIPSSPNASADQQGTPMQGDSGGRKWLCLTLRDTALPRPEGQVGPDPTKPGGLNPFYVPGLKPWQPPWSFVLDECQPENMKQMWRLSKAADGSRVLVSAQFESEQDGPPALDDSKGDPIWSCAYGYRSGEGPFATSELTISVEAFGSFGIQDIHIIAGDYPPSSEPFFSWTPGNSKEGSLTGYATKDGNKLYFTPDGLAALKGLLASFSVSTVEDLVALKTREEWRAYSVGAAGKSLFGQFRQTSFGFAAQSIVPLDYPYYEVPTAAPRDPSEEVDPADAVNNTSRVMDVFHDELRRRLSDEEKWDLEDMVDISLSDEEPDLTMNNAQAALLGEAAPAVGGPVVPPPAAAATPTPVQQVAQAAVVSAQNWNGAMQNASAAGLSDAQSSAISSAASSIAANAIAVGAAAAQAQTTPPPPVPVPVPVPAPPPALPAPAVPTPGNGAGGGGSTPTVADHLQNFLGLNFMSLFGSLEGLFPGVAPPPAAGTPAPPAAPRAEAAYAVLFQLCVVAGALAQAYSDAHFLMLGLQRRIQQHGWTQVASQFFLTPFLQFSPSLQGVLVASGMVPAGTDIAALQRDLAPALAGQALADGVTNMMQGPMEYAAAQATLWHNAWSLLLSVVGHASQTTTVDGYPSGDNVTNGMASAVSNVVANQPLEYPMRWKPIYGWDQPLNAGEVCDTTNPKPTAFQVPDGEATAAEREAWQAAMVDGTGGSGELPSSRAAQQTNVQGDLLSLTLSELIFRGNALVAPAGGGGSGGSTYMPPIAQALLDLFQIGTWIDVNSNPGGYAHTGASAATADWAPSVARMFQSGQINALQQQQPVGGGVPLSPQAAWARTDGSRGGVGDMAGAAMSVYVSNLITGHYNGLNARTVSAMIASPGSFFAGSGPGHGGMRAAGFSTASAILAYLVGVLSALAPPWYCRNLNKPGRRLGDSAAQVQLAGDNTHLALGIAAGSAPVVGAPVLLVPTGQGLQLKWASFPKGSLQLADHPGLFLGRSSQWSPQSADAEFPLVLTASGNAVAFLPPHGQPPRQRLPVRQGGETVYVGFASPPLSGPSAGGKLLIGAGAREAAAFSLPRL